MWKKAICWLLLCMAVPAFAAFQYESAYMGPAIRMTENSGLRISFAKGQDLVKSFGYYTFDPFTREVLSWGAGDLRTGYLGQLNQGDLVGFWVKTGTETLTTNFFLSQSGWQESRYENNFGYGNIGLGNNALDVTVGYNHPDYLNQITIGVSKADGSAAAPAGAPLPGVLAALGVGGGIVRIRRRRPQEA